MTVALGMNNPNLSEENFQFARQLGVEDLVIQLPDLGEDGYYDFYQLMRLRTRVEASGLRIAAIQNIPSPWYEKIRYNLPGRDQQIENYKRTLANLGKAGIPIFGYNFHAYTVWRTSSHTRGRGGALVTSYDHELMKDAPTYGVREIGEEELWENYAYFLERVMPVAEEAGVKMALHPDDPPLSPIAGAACLFRDVASFQKALDLVPSPYNGILFCQGCFTEMGGDVFQAIRHFGKQHKIFYVHFRNVKGSGHKFAEAFIDDGDMNMFQAIKVYKEVGFDGILIPDHLPKMPGDSDFSHRSQAYAIGYMRALVAAVNG